MIPIRDTAPCNSKPYVTWGLIIVCSVIFLIMLLLPVQENNRIMFTYGMTPLRYINPGWALAFGLPPDGYLSFVTNLFIHSSWLHIVINCWFLWIFADNVEDRMGHIPFLIFYLLCGVFATFLQYFFDETLATPVVGASGAIAGVLAAYFFLYPYARVVAFFPPIVISLPAVTYLGLWVIFQLYNATTAIVFSGAPTTVAWWAHLGGFFAGSVLYRYFVKDANKEIKEDTAQENEEI